MILDNPGKKRKDYRDLGLQIFRYYAINYPFFEMDFHSHEEWEIMYVVHGRCRITCVEEERERDYDLREGEYILTGGEVRHKLHVERNMPCRILNLEGRMEAMENAGYLEWLEKEPVFQAFCRDRAVVMSGNIYIRKAQEYLEEYFDQEIAISHVAEAAGVSEGYLQRLFKKETDSTIMDEILRLRVEKAKLLLENSTLPVIDIAVNVGFNSRQHFTAMFRQLTGSTPMEWRTRRGNVRVSKA